MLCCAACGMLYAQQTLHKDNYLIDIPTAEVHDHYASQFGTRMFAENSVMETIEFGVYPRLNVGIAFSAQNLTGAENPIRVLTPAFTFKYKLYDGSLYLPAIAIGYDGRKYGYDRPTKEYAYDQKGGFLVLSREIIIPNLVFHPGVNVSDFDMSDVFFFSGLNFNIEDKVNIMVEWDNVHRIKESWLNGGIRIYLSEAFLLDLALRDMTNSTGRERIIQLKYTVNF